MLEMIENKFAKYLAIGLFIVTVLVVAGPVSDPVNVPKLLAVGTLAFAILPYLAYLGKSKLFSENPLPTYLTIAFVGSALLAVIFSEAPLSQNLYGVNGRNTGLVALFSFAILYLVSSNFLNVKNISKFSYVMFFAGLVNLTYGFIEHYVGDPIPWNNNYGAFLGTFGNPNFSGAFMGLMFGLGLSFTLANLKNFKLLVGYAIFTLLSAVVVIFTKTTQGILVAGLTAGVSIALYLYKTLNRKIYAHLYSFSFLSIGALVILGILQKGPLSAYLYKRSVSLRGVYWDTAIQVGNSHPITGVGLDSFGDWFRFERSLKAATWLPGPEVISNAAHNLFLDMYANGGLLLFVSYLSITVMSFINIQRILKRLKSFDTNAAILISLFVGFQAQALISIAQIGIAIWGWILAGLLHSYSRILATEAEVSQSKNKKAKKISQDSPVGVFVFASAVIGLLISVPPYSADAKYTSAVNSQDLKRVEAALQPSYFNPISSQRYAMAAYLLEQNNFNDLSHKYALKGVEFNPHFYEAWKLLYILKSTTEEERKLALSKMKALDPLNPNLEKLK